MTSIFTSIGAITASATVLQGANGLLQAVLPLRMASAGLSVPEIGAVATAYGLGFAAGCLIAPPLVRGFGHVRAFAGFAAFVAVVALLFTQATMPFGWMVLRTTSGLALSVLFTVADSWIAERATLANRGRVVSIYMMFTKTALISSPLCVGFGEITGNGLFITIAALLCVSVIPLVATGSRQPPIPTVIRPNIRLLFRAAPSAVLGSFATGLMNGPMIALAPVYGLQTGFSPELAAALLFALQGGSLVLQWPFGWLSDHIDRRIVIAGLAAGTAAVSALMLWGSSAGPMGVIVGFALWGGLALCIYGVCVAHATDLVETSAILQTISTLLICWAVGTMIGPLLAAVIMERIGVHGLFFYSAVVALLLASFVVLRIILRPRRPLRGNFIDLPPSSPASASLAEETTLALRSRRIEDGAWDS